MAWILVVIWFLVFAVLWAMMRNNRNGKGSKIYQVVSPGLAVMLATLIGTYVQHTYFTITGFMAMVLFAAVCCAIGLAAKIWVERTVFHIK